MTTEIVRDTEALEHQPKWTPLTLQPIANATQYQQVADYLKTIKAFQKRVTEFFKPHKERALSTHRGLCDDERKTLTPAETDELTCKRLMIAYDQEQERLRQEEEQRRQAEARKQDEERRLAEAAALEREANATGDGSLLDEAMALVEQESAPVAIVPVEKATPKIAGISYRETWSAKVVNPLALVKFVAAHPEHINLVSPNLVALNQLARAMKGAMKVDGVHAVSDKQVAAGSR